MFNVQSFFFLACVRRLSSSSSSSSSSNQRINRSFWLCFNYIPFAGHKFCSTNCALRKHWHYIKNGQFSKNMWMCARIRACVDLCLLENWNTIFFATNKQKQQRKKNQKLNDKTQKNSETWLMLLCFSCCYRSFSSVSKSLVRELIFCCCFSTSNSIDKIMYIRKWESYTMYAEQDRMHDRVRKIDKARSVMSYKQKRFCVE